MSQVELPDQVWPSGNQGAGLSWPNPNVAAAINAFVDRGPFGVAVFDTDLRFLLVSQGLATLHGQEASETVGKRIDEVVPPPYGELVARPLAPSPRHRAPRPRRPDMGDVRRSRGAERSFTSSFYRLDSCVGHRPSGSSCSSPRRPSSATPRRRPARRRTQLELLQQVTDALSGGDNVADVTHAALTGAAQAVGASAAMIMALDEHGRRPRASGLDGPRRRHPGPTPRTGSTRRAATPLRHAAVAGDHPVGDRAPNETSSTPTSPSYGADHQAWAFVPLIGRGQRASAWSSSPGVSNVAFATPTSPFWPPSVVSVRWPSSRPRILDAEREARRATEFLVEVTRFVVEGSDAGVFAISNGQPHPDLQSPVL